MRVSSSELIIHTPSSTTRWHVKELWQRLHPSQSAYTNQHGTNGSAAIYSVGDGNGRRGSVGSVERNALAASISRGAGSISARCRLRRSDGRLRDAMDAKSACAERRQRVSGSGVRSCLEYARTGNVETARACSDPSLSPHLSFVDMGGHGYSVVRASSESLSVEFVCIPRPIERSTRADGGPIRYRVRHSAQPWHGTQVPSLSQSIVEGDVRFSI